ncbi:MAG: hypothetical protein Q8K32_00955 [Archangium sp.]|nr:hypothetical protein [Archangium sp.]
MVDQAAVHTWAPGRLVEVRLASSPNPWAFFVPTGVVLVLGGVLRKLGLLDIPALSEELFGPVFALTCVGTGGLVAWIYSWRSSRRLVIDWSSRTVTLRGRGRHRSWPFDAIGSISTRSEIVNYDRGEGSSETRVSNYAYLHVSGAQLLFSCSSDPLAGGGGIAKGHASTLATVLGVPLR